jgi:hypothetical protein
MQQGLQHLESLAVGLHYQGFKFCIVFMILFRLCSRRITIRCLWRADNRPILDLSVHRGDMGSRVRLNYFWNRVACGWRHYPRLRQNRNS